MYNTEVLLLYNARAASFAAKNVTNPKVELAKVWNFGIVVHI